LRARQRASRPNKSIRAGEITHMSTYENRAKAGAHVGALWRIASTRLPTRWGTFDAIGYERDTWAGGGQRVETAVALLLGNPREGAPLVRVHSQCLTGDVFGSQRCDCGGQLNFAMQAIAQERRGVVIYDSEEGRGIGLIAKLQAYELQDAGIDTIEANHALGFKADLRDFGLAAAIVRDLRISRVRLLTNNPQKVGALRDGGIDVVERIPCEVSPTAHSLAYLQTKKQKMGHTLSLIAEHSA
jgi:GTP cyclohydrolase II